MRSQFSRPEDHPADTIQHPLMGFDKAAYDAFYSGRKQTKIDILHAERRDSVAWMAWSPTGANITKAVLDTLPSSLSRQVFCMKINGLRSVRITGDPISFAANKIDHYIPADCLIEFIPIPLKEDR